MTKKQSDLSLCNRAVGPGIGRAPAQTPTNNFSGAAEMGGKGGQLPTQLLDPYVLSHATSFLSLFNACFRGPCFYFFY